MSSPNFKTSAFEVYRHYGGPKEGWYAVRHSDGRQTRVYPIKLIAWLAGWWSTLGESFS